MINFLRCLLLLCLLSTIDVVAEVRPIVSITDLEEVVTADTLVLTDIDMTLMRSSVSLGWGPWWIYVNKALSDAGIDKTAARPVLYPIATWIRQHTPMELMEPQTAYVIERLQSRGVATLALTARSKGAPHSPHFDRLTRDQLLNFGIDFTKSQPIEVASEEKCCASWGYSDGVIYTQGGLKGPSLVAFLFFHGYRPNRIVLIDDNLEMLESVDEAMEREGISFLGLHYVREALPFSREAANVQLHHLMTKGFVPNDDEALILFKNGPERSPDYFLDHMIEHIRTVIGI